MAFLTFYICSFLFWVTLQIKREPEAPPTQSSFQNALIGGQSNVIHAPRLQTSLESQFSVPDALASPKKMDPFRITSSLSQTVSQLHKTQLAIPASSVIVSKDEMVKGTDTKEIMGTPPAIPRPHSSDSFFQLSASPQSQLLASLDSHSQPSPATSKILSKSVIESPKSNETNVQGTVEMTLPTKMSHHPPVGSPNHAQLQPSVEQFVLQSSLTSANLVKQLSQYKETFGSITSTTRTLLTSDKPIEQQNLEQFLQEGLPTYSPKTQQQQQQHQLKDLLQSKKFCESDENKEGK